MTNGATEGLNYCTNVLIPSLFPFMVLSSFLVKVGLSERLEVILSPFTKTMFNLPGSTGLSIILSMIGGYPVGARGIISLLEQKKINETQAKQMSLFMVGGGPAFIVFVVGDILLKNRTIGIILWGSQVITQLLLGVLIKFSVKKVETKTCSNKNSTKMSFSCALVEACNDGVTGILRMCGLVVLFSAVFGIIKNIQLDCYFAAFLEKIGIPKHTANAILPILWEVTKGCSEACTLGSAIYLVAFALGWGGLCVHFQVYSQLSLINISKLKFTFMRFLQGLLSAILTAIFLEFCPQDYLQVFSTLQTSPSYSLSTTYIGGIALIVMFILFLFSTKSKSNQKNNKVTKHS